MTGRLIGVVGPSGVGKDTVMQAIADRRSDIGLVRRVITRGRDSGGEDFVAVSEEEFAKLAHSGAFCLHWRAHGLSYGVPAEVLARIAAGEVLLVNLSRQVLPQAAATVPGFSALNLTARPETLAARLAGRGREDRDAIAKRLARADMALPAGVSVLNLSNDGPIEATVEAALALLYPVSA